MSSCHICLKKSFNLAQIIDFFYFSFNARHFLHLCVWCGLLQQQQHQQLYFLTLNIQISHHLQIARLIEAGGVWTAYNDKSIYLTN